MKSVLRPLPLFCFLHFLLLATPSPAEPLALKTALSAALANNPLVAEARLGVEASAMGVVSAKGKHYPRVSLDANFTQRQEPVPYVPAQSPRIGPHFSDNFASYQFLATIPLYQGGLVVNGVELAQLRKRLQEETLVLTRNDIIANTVNTYNKILQVQKLRQSSLASVTALEEQRKNAQLLLDMGRAARVDLLKVDVQLANYRQNLLDLDESLANLAATLQYLMGKPTDGKPEPPVLSDPLSQPDPTTDFDAGLATAERQRPEYLLAQAAVREASLNYSAVRGRLLPNISSYGGYLQQYGFDPAHQESNWFFGVNLSVPVFEKPLYADLAQERVKQAKAQERLRAVENQMRLELRTALSSLAQSKKKIETASRATAQAEESFRIEQEKFKCGAGAMVDLLLAQAADLTAAANYTQALFDYNAALVAWHKASGTLEDYLK